MSSFLTQPSLGVSGTVAASAATSAVDCQQMSKVSFQITQTNGTLSWVATVQESNDGTNWVDTTSTVALSAAGTKMLDFVDACARYYRLNLVKTSGSLTGLSVIFNGKF